MYKNDLELGYVLMPGRCLGKSEASDPLDLQLEAFLHCWCNVLGT